MFRKKQDYRESFNTPYVKEVKTRVDSGNGISIRSEQISMDSCPIGQNYEEFSFEAQVAKGEDLKRVNTKVLNPDRVSLDDVPLNPDYFKPQEPQPQTEPQPSNV